MAAVRVSDTIVSIEIDVPTQESSEIVHALAKQVVAYSLRNMVRAILTTRSHQIFISLQERIPYSALTALPTEANADSDGNSEEKTVQVPDILLHIVGRPDDSTDVDLDDPAPDSDYIVGGTGVVKALSVCLGNKAADYRRPSRDVTPSESGVATPRPSFQVAKSKAMSKNLLGSARKIKARLQPAMAREAKEGDDLAYSMKTYFLLVLTTTNLVCRTFTVS